VSVLVANRHGQQLFFADLFRQKRTAPQSETMQRSTSRNYPVACEQLVLFSLARDLRQGHRLGFPTPPDPTFALVLDQAAHEHARTHGWSKTRLTAARQGIRILLCLQDTPGAVIKASEVARLDQLSLAQQPIRDILAAVGMLDDDREPSLIPWFAHCMEGLPEPMAGELRTWFDVLRLGNTTPPRFRPRSTSTVRLRVRYAVPVLRTWAAAGHTSLREITRDHIRQALPAQGSDRSLVGQALRSLFRVLKARRVVFTNPTARIRIGSPETRNPLPVQTSLLHEALRSEQPARAVLAALVGFHALRNGQLRELQLTDVREGRLYLLDRTILLAPPVRERLAAWLNHRARRWPRTVNPHLLINTYTAVRTGAVSNLWVNQTLGLSTQAVREDRILDEAIATGGDIRRLCDLFGLSVKGGRTLHRDT
jgi:hypothetical protein